jgi:hypothetical protein
MILRNIKFLKDNIHQFYSSEFEDKKEQLVAMGS